MKHYNPTVSFDTVGKYFEDDDNDGFKWSYNKKRRQLVEIKA